MNTKRHISMARFDGAVNSRARGLRAPALRKGGA